MNYESRRWLRLRPGATPYWVPEPVRCRARRGQTVRVRAVSARGQPRHLIRKRRAGRYAVFGVSPVQDRENAFLHTQWDVNSNLTLFAEGLFDRTYTSLHAQYRIKRGR
jgi:hypothetical protein